MSTDSTLIAKKTDRGIQILRILACIAVFVCHFGQRMCFEDISSTLFNVSQLGRYGVELFFVISGYLACFSLSGGKSVIRFYKKRIVRILPLYYFCILYYFITETFFFKEIPNDPQHLGWLRYIFCLNGVVPSDGDYFWTNLGITWTIPVFLIFYLLAPLVVKFSKSIIISSAILIGFIGLRIVVNKTMPGWFTAFNYLPCFIFGVIVYNAKKDHLKFVTTVVLLGFVILLKWVNYREPIPGFFDEYVISALFAVMLLFSEQFTVYKVRVTKILDVMDEHSYTLYLVHGIVFCGIIDKFSINIYLRAVIAIFGTAILTIVIHRFVEKPIQKILTKALSV